MLGLLDYEPKKRITAIEALCHPFFDELREFQTRIPSQGEKTTVIFISLCLKNGYSICRDHVVTKKYLSSHLKRFKL